MDDETQEDDATFDSQHQLWRDTSECDRSAFEFTGNFGVKLELQGITDPVGIFKSFIDGDIIELLVTEINNYARKYIDEKHASGKMKRKSRDLLWQDTNEGEVFVMLALVALQGIVNKPHINDYHSTNPLLHTPIFGKIMSRDRFLLIMKYLHFTDEEESSDPLKKIRPLLDLLFVSKFKESYTPERNISIDESLLLWKGRLKWKRYIPLKRAKFWIESFILAESKTGYVWNLCIYTGKETRYDCAGNENITKPSKVVLHLLEPLLNQSYCLGIDNYYSSPELYDILLKNKTDAVGTVRCNRKNLSAVVNRKKLKKGETVKQYKGKIMHLKWKDKKDVNMLTTIYEGEMEEVSVAG